MVIFHDVFDVCGESKLWLLDCELSRKWRSFSGYLYDELLTGLILPLVESER